MEKKTDFNQSLSKYFWKRMKSLPVNWWLLGVGIVGLVMMASLLEAENTTAYVKSRQEAIEKAVRQGDYQTAMRLLEESSDNKVLGAQSELEELVYPERKIEREIAKYEDLNIKYPGSRDILLALADLYKQLGNVEKANEYRDAARTLDPNNEIFKEK